MVDEPSTIDFISPEKAGEYRLSVYALDGASGVAITNIPFSIVE